MATYRITSPLTQTSRVEPARLGEQDFVRWGTVSTLGDTTYQNAKLKTPVKVFRNDEVHEYPVNAYIRIYESNRSIHLISKHPLP